MSADVNPATSKTKPHTDGEREGEKGSKKKKVPFQTFHTGISMGGGKKILLLIC